MTLKASNYPTVRPSLDLNLAQTERLDPRITFSRASTGTYVDNTGIIRSAATNQARFDHDPVTGGNLGLLMEGSRTNLVEESVPTTFSFHWWNFLGGTGSGNAALAPDNTLTAAEFTHDGSSTDVRQYIPQITNLSAGTTYIGSIFLKSIIATTFQIGKTGASDISGTTGTFGGIVFDLSAGTVSSSGTDVWIEPYPNGWYKCSFAFVANTANASAYIIIYPGTGYNFYFWGGQIEVGSYPTSYIPTTSSTVTRAADVATVTNSNVYNTDSFTIINQPFGSSAGASELTLFDGPEPIKRVSIYDQNLSQATINTAAEKTDEFWRWRILGSSFALPNFATDGQVTVDWGDGTVETLTASEHTFSDGSGYHDIGFKLDSGTYFRPFINDNASHDTKVVAVGPAPVSMKLDAQQVFWGCSNLEAFDATVDTSSGTIFNSAWRYCSSLTSFPLIDTSAGTNFQSAWQGCSSLTSFPSIDMSSGTVFFITWQGCSSLTSFPLIDTSSGVNFRRAWENCSSLTDFPANFFDSWSPASINDECFYRTWDGCTSLTPASVVNILNSIAASGQSAPSGTGTNDKRIDIDWDGTGTPATTAAAAITTLKSRNWEIYLNGALQ